MPTLFVYGTLKRGDCRHHALADERFLGYATTQSRYRLYHLGDYPALINCKDGDGAKISGELYEVDDACLLRLDIIEGVAEGLYQRGPVDLQTPWHEKSALTYFYQHSVADYPEITQWSSTKRFNLNIHREIP